MQLVAITLALVNISKTDYGSTVRLIYRPTLIAVCEVSFSPSAVFSVLRDRSPRRQTPAMITDLPPSMIFCLPSICDLREILFPVS